MSDQCCGNDAEGCCASPAGIKVSLASLKRGQTGVVCESRLGTGDAALLRAMGLHPAARIRLCRSGEPCIVAVSAGGGPAAECGCGSECRIGLARALAERIFVTPNGTT